MMHHRGRVAFARFWYARGPLLMVSLAYGITLMLAVLTVSKVTAPSTTALPDQATTPPTQTAHLLGPAQHLPTQQH